MATLTVFSNTNDVGLVSSDDQYNDARDGVGLGSVANTDTATARIGQTEPLLAPIDLCEVFLEFDTSSLPNGADVSAATLSLWVTTDGSTADFTIEARTHYWNPADGFSGWIAGGNLAAKTLLASVATLTGITAGAYNTLTENGTSFQSLVEAHVNDTTEMVLVSSKLTSGTAPVENVNETVTISTADETGTSQDPKLVVTYTDPTVTKSLTGRGVITAEALGLPTVVFGSISRDLTDQAIPSGEIVSQPGNVSSMDLTDEGIATEEDVTQPYVQEYIPIEPIDSVEAFGGLVIRALATPMAIASEEALGLPAPPIHSLFGIGFGIEVIGATFGLPNVAPVSAPIGVVSAESFGSLSKPTYLLYARGVISAEAFGSPASPLIIFVITGIATAEAFGLPSLPTVRTAQAIGTAEALGLPSVSLALSPLAIVSEEALGLPTVVAGAVSILGITSAEAFDLVRYRHRLKPLGITTAEAFGSPTKAMGSVTLQGQGVPTEEALGQPSALLVAAPSSIASEEAFGLPTIQQQAAGTITREIIGIDSEEAFGLLSLGQLPITIRPPPALAYAYAPTPSLSGVTNPVGLQHTFIPAGAEAAELLTDTLSEEPRTSPLVADFKDLLTVHGGFMSANAQVSEIETAEFPTHYGVGATWLVKDLALDKYIFGGVLEKPGTQAGVTTITAEGWGMKADREVERWRWQARPGIWRAGSAFPFKYQHGTLDHATRILGGPVARTKNELNSGAEIEFHIDGTIGPFKHDDEDFEWQSPVVQWTPDNNHRRISFKIEHRDDRHDSDFQLDVCTVDVDEGDISDEYDTAGWTVHDTFTMGAAGATEVDITFPPAQDHNLLALIMRRTGPQSKEKKARKFRIYDIRVWGQRGDPSRDTLTIKQALVDIFNQLGAASTSVEDIAFDVLPMESQKSTLAQIADELVLYAGKWFWRMTATAEGEKKGEAGSFGFFKTWDVVDVRQPVQFLPDEQYNKIAFQYSIGDSVDLVSAKLSATVNPFPAGYNKVFNLDVEEPTPETPMRIWAQAVIDYLSEERVTGSSTLAFVRDPSTGEVKRAHIVEPGDKLRFYDEVPHNLTAAEWLAIRSTTPVRETVTVAEIQQGDVLCEMQFASGNPLLDKWIARRKRLLALGHKPASATLGPLGTDKPLAPTGLTLAFDESHRAGGKRYFEAIVNWSRVFKDVWGHETAIRKYLITLQPMEDNEIDPKPQTGPGHVKRIEVSIKDDKDDPDDLIPTIKRIEIPQGNHTVKWRAKVHAEDVQGKISASSGFTPSAKPAAFRPRDVDAVIVDVDQHGIEFLIECDDLDETDQDAQPKMDRSVNKFKYRVYKDNVLQTFSGKSLFETKSLRKRIKIKKPGTATWKIEAKAVDDYGNTSENWVSGTNVKGIPPTPATPVAGDISFELGGKEGFRARFAFNYSGVHDDDIAKVHVHWLQSRDAISDQDADSIEVSHRSHIAFKPSESVQGTARWHGLRKGRHIRIAWAVEDTRGNRSTFSGWSP